MVRPSWMVSAMRHTCDTQRVTSSVAHLVIDMRGDCSNVSRTRDCRKSNTGRAASPPILACPSNAWKPHLDTDKRCKNHYYDREEDRQVSFHTDSDEVVE